MRAFIRASDFGAKTRAAKTLRRADLALGDVEPLSRDRLALAERPGEGDDGARLDRAVLQGVKPRARR